MPGLLRSHRRFLNGPAVYTGALSSGLELTYAGTQTVSLGTAGSPLFNNVPVGTAYSNRRVLICVTSGGSYLQSAITDVLINGASVGTNKILVYGSGGSAGSYSGLVIWAWADIASGTSVTVDISLSSSPNGSGAWACSAYTFDKTLVTQTLPSESHNNVPSSSGVNTNTATIVTYAGGFLISAMQCDILVSSSALTVTASTETMTTDYVNNGSTAHQGVASKKATTAANAASFVTWSWTTNSQSFQSLLHWY